MLTLRDLHLTVGNFALTADWQVNPGDRVALIGPSGAGKSTLLAAIAGFIPHASGEIQWNGQPLGPAGTRPVSILFQDQNLFPHLTIAQNLGLGLNPALRLSPAQHKAVEDALAQVGLAGFGPRKPAQLSGGQQGRAALARALLRARPLLLLDEPFAALGPALKSEMLDLVASVAGATGAALLMVTHDPADARHLCPQTVLVANGKAHAPVSTADLFANPPEALQAYLGESR
ncbi:MAG: ATP-binding cassette domain-containing protein [Pseudomonadota bacterium]